MGKENWTEEEIRRLRVWMYCDPRPSYGEMARALGTGKSRGAVAGKIMRLKGYKPQRPPSLGRRRKPRAIPPRLARWVGYFRAAGWSSRVIYHLFNIEADDVG